MSNKYNAMTSNRHVGHVMLVCIMASLIAHSHCFKYDTQLKLIVNDDDLMLQQERNHAAAAAIHQAQQNHQRDAVYSEDAAHEHNGFGSYRSELKRLSYETIHRILRDENEPIFRREDNDLRFYQKRSYQPVSGHIVTKRSVPVEEDTGRLPVDMSSKNLRDFSMAAVKLTEDPSLITAIDLQDNLLEHIDLKGFDSLTSINLTNNSLTDLPDLTELPHLSVLHMNGNHVRDVRPQINFHLHTLHLSGNAIVNLSSVQLSTLNALESLDLSCNKISSLETTFFPQRMHNLRHLNLANNQLGSIYRETFYNLLSLNTLLLAHNNISEIDYETFLALPNLQNLDLSYNSLKGESIRALQGIPDLVRLSIAYNPDVGALMQEFVASWSLKELDASGTGLCQIPAALAQSVRMLKLSDNWLKVINCGDLDSYPLLQYLDLSRSRIEDIEDDALGRLEILETLFLDHNQLRKVPLSLPTSLEHLFLQYNQIQDIPEQTFQVLNNLQTLDLSGNKLLYLPALQLPKLLTLNLQSSELKGLSQSIVHTMPHLRDLWVDDNPIKCSDLLGIAEWASPCRAALEIDDDSGSDGGGGGGADAELGQGIVREEGGKIDLKRNFVRMHNFYENFTKNSSFCQQQQRQQQQRQRQMMLPPACAREFNDHVALPSSSSSGETTIAAPLAEVISPTNPTIMLMMKNVATISTKDEPATSTSTATMRIQQLTSAYNQINLSKTFAANKQTTTVATPPRESASTSTAQSLMNEKLMGRRATSNTEMPRMDKIKANQQQTTHQEQQQGEPLQQQQTLQEQQQKLQEQLQQDEPLRPSLAELSKLNSSRTKTTVQPHSSLNSEMKLSTGDDDDDDDDDTAETTNFILKPTMLTPTTTTTTATELPVIKTDNNLDASRGLLSKKWLKLSKTLKRQSPTDTATATTTTTTKSPKATAAVMASVETETPTAGQRLQLMATAQPIENLATISVSGRQNQKTTLTASGNKNEVTPATTTTGNQTPQTPHHHNSLQLHIKDRHLIGTPLLMHNGENVMVEAKLLPNLSTANAEETSTATRQEHLAGDVMTTTTTTTPTTPQEPTPPPHEQRLKGNDINVLAKSQQQHEHETSTHPIKPLTNDNVNAKPTAGHIHTSNDRKAKDPKHGKETKEHSKKPSLIMKKMTITKMHPTPHTHTQQPLHYTLNTPRANEALIGRDFVSEKNPTMMVELKEANHHHQSIQQQQQHGSINTARQQDQLLMGGGFKMQTTDHMPNTLQHGQDRERPSKTEHLLDVRKSAHTTGHPGLVLLLSFALFVVLLVGLMHVYRCDMPWRRHLNAHHQRPHRHGLNAEDDSHSFLSYQQNSSHLQQQPTAIQQWHHSIREKKPFQSPLHHLHVRELQQVSAVDDRHHQRRPPTIGLYGGGGTATTNSRASDGGTSSHSSSSGTNSPGSHSLSGSEHLDGNETFYIEMTTEPGQQALHSDMLPMELLSVSRSNSFEPRQMADNESFLYNTRECDSGQATEVEPSGIVDGSQELLDEQQPSQKRSTRKFGLW